VGGDQRREWVTGQPDDPHIVAEFGQELGVSRAAGDAVDHPARATLTSKACSRSVIPTDVDPVTTTTDGSPVGSSIASVSAAAG
jgi:hypothetical protein